MLMNVLLVPLIVMRMLIALIPTAVSPVHVKLDILTMVLVMVNHVKISTNVLQSRQFATIKLPVPILMVASAAVVTVALMVMDSPDELPLAALILMNVWTLTHAPLIPIAKTWTEVSLVHVKLVSVDAQISTNANLELTHAMKTLSAMILKDLIPVPVIQAGKA